MVNALPSQERPWLKYYESVPEEATIPSNSLYETLAMNCADILDEDAFILSPRDDEHVTFSDFIELSDRVAQSLLFLGCNTGEIAATFKNSVEGIAVVFAKSRIGLTSHLIDPTNSPLEVHRMLEESSATVLFVAQEFVAVHGMSSAGTSVKTVVVMPSDGGICDASSLSCEGIQVYDWAQFLELGKDVALGDVYQPARDEGSIIIYTGGSTGTSKGVILSEYSFVSKYNKEVNSYMKWGRGRLSLGVLPGTIAFGLSEGITCAMLAGETTVLVDCYAIPRFAEFILRYRPQDISCSPIHMEFLINSPLITPVTDLSFLESFPCGGDGMSKEADIKVRDFLAEHGAKDSFAQGCGFTECAGAFCFGLAEGNKPGGMGIPLAWNTCGVFDPETGEELGYNQAGEWAVLTDTAMLGYFGSAADRTQESLKVHADGKTWLHPGDVVHMDEDGVIFMHDRVSRTFNIGGMKVYPSALETIMSKHPGVQRCVVSGVKVSSESGFAITDQKVPIANIAVSPEFAGREREIATEVDSLLREKAQTYIHIEGYVFREQMPFTSRGKVDYQCLEAEGLGTGDGKIIVRER